MRKITPDILVVGAGVCGLTIADLLSRGGKQVAVIERESMVGGLARTFHYPEGSFDIGPHRFHTIDQKVLSYLDEVIAEDTLRIPRKSLVHFHRHYYNWPIHPTLQLLKLPWRIVLGVAFDMLFFLYQKKHPHTFEDYILNMYGQTLYRTFFNEYSRKFVGISPAETHVDWAKTGIDRAIIDERLKINTLGELIKSVFVRPKGAEVLFRYPHGGVMRFAEKLRDRIEAGGGTVRLNQPVVGLTADAQGIQEIRTEAATWRPKQVVWTASITELLRLAGETPPKLEYLDLLCYNLVTNRKHEADFQWCYFGSPDLAFSRVSRPEAFDPDMMKPGYFGLCAELTTRKNTDVWADPEAKWDEIIDGLMRVGLLADASEIESRYIERIPEAYPIYRVFYDRELEEGMTRCRQWSNLHMAGRTGTFWYNNMDHSIAAGLTLADQLLAR